MLLLVFAAIFPNESDKRLCVRLIGRIVDHLQEVAGSAAEMLRTARKQQANNSKQRFYD